MLLSLLLVIPGVMLMSGCGRATPVLDLKNSSDDGNGQLTIAYFLRDIDETASDLLVSFSEDGGVSWREATAGTGGDGTSGLSTSQKGTYHTYVWDYGSDIGPGLKQNVRLWLLPVDTDGDDRGKGGITDPLTFGGPIMYVANYGDDTVSIINTQSFGGNAAVIGTINVGQGPYRMTYVPSMQKIYIGNRLGGSVSVIDTKTNILRTTITVGNDPSALAVSWDEDRIYVTNRDDDTVTGITTGSDVSFANVTVGNSPSGITVGKPNPVNGAHEIYVSNSDDNSVSVITVDPNGDLHVGPSALSVGNNPEGIAVSPDGIYLWVVCSGEGEVWVFETANLFTEDAVKITIGDLPTDIVFTEDGQYAYINNFASHDIVKINAITMSPEGYLSANSSPVSLTISSDGRSLYVSNYDDSFVTGINPDTNSILGTTTVGTNPAGIVILPGAP
jgi:YVTN family beta-propeller protein